MALHKTFNDKRVSSTRGFTLIEVLIVLTLITMIAGLSLFFNIDMYRGDSFRAERNILVVALQTARADALNNINQKKHGVAINPTGYEGYVVFEGNNFASSEPNTRKEIPASYGIELDALSPDEVVFSQLSGNANFEGEIILIDPLRNASATIAINNEGKIGW